MLVLPTIATVALGTALLVPLRDDRRGKRATRNGAGTPLRADFGALMVAPEKANCTLAITDEAGSDTPPTVAPNHFRGSVEDRNDGHEGSPGPSDAAPEGAEALGFTAAPTTHESFATALFKRFGVRVPRGCRPQPQDDAGMRHDERENSATQNGHDLPEVPTERRRAKNVAAFWQSIVPRVAAGWNGIPPQSAMPAPSTASAEDALVERSFASELASLIALPSNSESPSSECHSPLPATLVEPFENFPPLVLQTAPAVFDRVLPLTRLPLRPHVDIVSWPGLTPITLKPYSRAERHAKLAALARAPEPAEQSALMQAYREEDTQGRILALRALLRGGCVQAHPVFVEALRSGTDEERAIAVDALISIDDRAAVTAAFSDRVDAIAAKAALAYVGMATAQEYRTALDPYMDAARIEVMLELLAGIIE